ncbi:MAG: hypothetical protein PHS49_07900 [Candidatus Gracilibacteria bacterium]|nr:hypothetical protein [Candidatus Gracilibacteria bacterium]
MKYVKQFIINILLFSLAGITYAAFTPVSNGDPLTATTWNSLLSKVDGIFTDGTGKVGIGNEAPTEKLDVTGNIKASGSICGANGCIGTAGSAFSCTEEFDYIETGNSVITYNPSAAKKAELMVYGIICWNRTDDGQKISPLDGYDFSNGAYGVWNGTNYKVCGRITYYDGTNYLISWSNGNRFGLRYYDGVTNTVHGRWVASAGAEGSGGYGVSDRWTIWTCK